MANHTDDGCNNTLVCDVDSWVTLDDVLACGTLCKPITEADACVFLTAAAEHLYTVTGMAFPGVCETTLRPCRETECGCTGCPKPYKDENGVMRNGCGCPNPKSCCEVEGLPLWPGPVCEITSVLIDGQPFGEWQLVNGELVRCDGLPWPYCQDRCLPATEPGTFEIKYRYGRVPPTMLCRAAALLARELLCACLCPSKCRLSKYWETISRDGISVTNAVTSVDTILTGLTGIDPTVDMAIAPYLTRGGKIRRPAYVLSPDIDLGRHVWHPSQTGPITP